MADPPGPVGVCDSGSDLSGCRGSEPVGGFGVGQERRLRRVGGAVLDDVDVAHGYVPGKPSDDNDN
ncbi:hypothetical protein ACFY3M_55090 [Streptomyces mirabilis]|uniref:hypothetical protein n=1 Tax=Streptomyces mirabilis TaxID=68239 RepID=UPI0036A2FE65